jgi:hypothetical protein
MTVHRRALTEGETQILAMIRDGYGSKNTVDEVFITPADEATIFVKDSAGTPRLMASLTNLAVWRADATIPNDDALRKDWLRLE